ncbi:tricorn protease [Paucibacter oligotrophus]|uniref:Tricorn protease homolog n=1 Tax=Roseateles oligotrophus TaxID=1769250 RepID=A0A840LDI3_9BURK|nr:S41 family peptidase [Roseateles oligotrophus]MBB4844733.1 tricorn protease [Roseateles oligotrophus]
MHPVHRRPAHPAHPLVQALAATLIAGSGAALAQANSLPGPGFYRQPAVHGQNVYLVAEGDLWRVGLTGGRAERLSTHGGQETLPAVSPDGQYLAFVGQYDGPGDVYLLPVQGGLPKRLSWDGAALRVWGFSAQGEVLFTGPAQDGRPITQLYAVDPKTLARRTLPVGQASDGALSADGRQLFFTRNGLRGDNARQYRGGAIARLWTLDLASQAEARPLLAEGANDKRPMPYKAADGSERIAFLSDRDGTVNLWSVDLKGQDLRQHSQHKGWDIRHASVSEGRAVYALGADLYSLDLNAAAGSSQKLDIQLGGDFEQQRQRWITKPQDFLTDTHLAPNGERVLLASRGHLATQGLGTLRRAELPQPDYGRCRTGEFSADSKSVFALCDFSGEREIWRFAANGLGKPEQLTQGAQAMRSKLLPSPDGRYLAHQDKEGHLFLTDLKASGKDAVGATKQIAHNQVEGNFEHLAWSPDGQALAFTQTLSNANRAQLMLFNLKDGRTHQLSSERYDNEAPAFTPDGRWLYFTSQRHFAVSNTSGPWGDRNMGPFFDRRTRLYALALQSGQRFPFAAKTELDGAEAKAEEKAEGKSDNKPEAKAKPAIQWEGLKDRLFEVPLAAGNYSHLKTDGKRLWFLDAEGGAERKTSLKTLSIDNLGGSAETVSADVRSFELSADGKKLMLLRGNGGSTPEILLVDAAPKLPAELPKFQVRWSDWQIATEPRQEWRQMFQDGWRMHRDYFYDKQMHGVDWPAMRAKYEPLVERVRDRAELAELMAQLVGELGALHSQVNAGDVRKGEEGPGLAGLGARFSRSGKAGEQGLRIEQIYRSDPELPAEQAPLAAAGLDLKVGDVITAINGRKISEATHESELLRGQAGRQVLLQVRTAEGKDVQRIVTPVDGKREGQLRYADWRYSRAQAVAAASGGRIGYLHLRAMGRDDIADFVREFYAQTDREGLIIDVRFNGGGNIDSWILEKLLRRAWAYWQRRSPEGSATFSNMQQSFRGHLAVLINEETYSDGETFSEGIKRLGLGPTIGKTTSGAGVWLSDQNRLLDNGIMRAAETGQMSPDGKFIVEGKGVTPDIEVDNPPRATFGGADAQLDAAIALLKKAMADKPLPQVKPGPYLRPVKP